MYEGFLKPVDLLILMSFLTECCDNFVFNERLCIEICILYVLYEYSDVFIKNV